MSIVVRLNKQKFVGDRLLNIIGLFLLNVFLFCNVLLANNFDHRFQKAFSVQRLSIEQGLSQSVVYDTIQDAYGYIWVATEDGLNRFDGYEFTVFEHKHSDPNSLHENLIYTLLEEPNKGIWIGTQNGLSFFNFNTQKFKNYTINENFPLAGVISLARSDDGKLYIGSENGLFFFEDEKIEPFVSNEGFMFDREVFSINITSKTIYFSTAECFYSISTSNLKIIDYCNNDLKILLNDRTIKTIKLSNTDLWVGTNNGLIRYDLDSHQTELLLHDSNNKDSISANFIQALEFDSEGNLWIGTSNGADLIDFSTERVSHYKHLTHDNDGLSSSDIISVFIDRAGLVWLGTYTGGLNILNPRKNAFEHILTKSELFQLNTTNAVHGITQDNNENLWVASSGGGLLKVDLMTGEIGRPFNEKISKAISNDAFIYSLLVDRNNRLWVGSASAIALIDLSTQKLIKTKVFINQKENDFEDYIFSIYEDHSGVIWIGTLNGLFYLDEIVNDGSKASIYLIDKTDEMPKGYKDRSKWVTTILETNDGNLWVGGQSGLAMYSTKLGEWFHHQYQSNNPQSLSYDDIQCMFEDSRGILWVGTANGLNKVNRNSDDEVYFERVTKENGLVNNVIYGILEDDNKQLWLSTNYGITRYSEHADNLQAFKKSDGLSSNEFNKGAYWADENGLLYFGSINGVTVIQPHIERKLERQQNLKFTQVKVGNRLVNIDTLNTTLNPKIEKYVGEDIFTLEVSDIYYEKLSTQLYRYRLKGLDDKWTELKNERRFILARLAAGNYQLEIQSRLPSEKWQSNSLFVELIVHGSFWNSKSAIYVLSFAILLIFFIVIYFVSRYFKIQIAKIKTRLSLKTIHLKESRQSNSELKKELAKTSNEIDLMLGEMSKNTRQINSIEFRDPISGFYRLDSIKQLLKDKLKDSSLLSFDLIAALYIADYDDVDSKYGEICAAELSYFVATELKNSVSANTYICHISDSQFILFANIDNSNRELNSLVDFRKRLIRTQISIANGLTIQTNIGMTYLGLYPEKISDVDSLFSLSRIIVQFQSDNISRSKTSLNRLSLNEAPNNYRDAYTNIEAQLINTNKIEIHHL